MVFPVDFLYADFLKKGFPRSRCLIFTKYDQHWDTWKELASTNAARQFATKSKNRDSAVVQALDIDGMPWRT